MIFRKEQYIILGVKLGCLKARCAAIFFSKCMATNDWFGKMTKPKSYFLISTSVFLGKVRVGTRYT